jgi:signal transduction histidine kinase
VHKPSLLEILHSHHSFQKILHDSKEFRRCPGRNGRAAQLTCGVERITKADHAYAVAAAAAHDFNNELTVILSSVVNSIMSLEPGHPARPHLLDLQEAAERCTRTTSGLLAFSFSRGARLSAAPFESLIAN